MNENLRDEIYPGEFVKLKKPVFTKTFGQGNPPEGLRVSYIDKVYFIPWDSVLKISETCDPLNQVADLQARPYPLLHINFYLEHRESFEIIKSERSSVNE